MADGSSSPAGTSDRIRAGLLHILFASFGYVAIRMLIAPVRIKVLTSVLSKEDYGLLTLIMLTVSFAMLVASCGSLEYMLRKIPGTARNFQLSILRTITTWFGAIAGGVGLAGVAILIAWQPGKLGLGTRDLVAWGLIFVITVHLTQLVYFLMGQSRYAQSRMLMLFYADAWFLPLLGLMWYIDLTVHFILWFWVAWLVASFVFSQLFISTRAIMRHPASPGLLREILVFGVPLLPMILGEWIFQMVDRYVLLARCDLAAVANYTLCFNIAWVGVNTGTSLLDILVTEFYKARNRIDSKDRTIILANQPLKQAFTLMLRSALVLGIPMTIGLWTGREQIILLLSDAKYIDAAAIMSWVAPLPLLYLMVIITGRTMMALDRGAVVGAATLCAAGLHLGLSITLAPSLAGRGIALAGCTAYGLLALFLGLKSQAFRLIEWRELQPLRIVTFAVVLAAGFYWIFTMLGEQNLLSLLAAGAFGILVMFAFRLIRRSDIDRLSPGRDA